MNRTVLLAVVSAMMAACGGEGGPLMRPGEDCYAGCHDGSKAHKFTVAGTVFGAANAAADAGVEGVTVIITGADQQETRLTTNAVGNFYTTDAIAAPFKVVVERGTTRLKMDSTPSAGCASCHTSPPLNNAPGRIYAAP